MKLRIENLDLVHKTRVELFPLIDVIFLLLVFFIYSMLSMTVHKGIKVNLPGAKAVSLNQQQDYHMVSITKAGKLFFNKEAVSKERLKDKITALPDFKNTTIFIDADKEVSYQSVVVILDLLRSFDIKKVSLSTSAIDE